MANKPAQSRTGEKTNPSKTALKEPEEKSVSQKPSEPKSDEKSGAEKPKEASGSSFLSRGIFAAGLLLCGVAAGALLAPRFAPQYFGYDTSEIRAEIAAQQQELSARLDALEARDDSNVLNEMSTQLQGLRDEFTQQLAAFQTQIEATDGAEIEARVASLETAGAGLQSAFDTLARDLAEAGASGSTAEVETTLAELNSLRAQIAELSAMNGALSQKIDEIDISATKRVEEADAAAERDKTKADEAEAARQGEALKSQIATHLTSGQSLASIFAQFNALGIELPAALLKAEAGVATLSELQDTFSAAAHQALRADAGQSDGAQGFASQIQSFFQSQISIRSLDAQDGETTDAILSRVGAALENGDLIAVTSEATALSDPAKAAMQDWLDAVTLRQDAFTALNDLNLEQSR